MHQETSSTSGNTALLELIGFLLEELREARRNSISYEDRLLLEQLNVRAKRRVRRLERLDAQTPPQP